MKTIENLTTPALLVDAPRLAQNIARMSKRIPEGLALRIHAKTCKSLSILRKCTEKFPMPIAVSTLAEAQYFCAYGIEDIIYAVGISPAKLSSVRKMKAMPDLILDNLDTAKLVADFADKNGGFNILLEIDCDGHRGGFAPDSPDLLKATSLLVKHDNKIRGVLTHAGAAYEIPSPTPEAFAELSRQECAAAIYAASELRHIGHDAPVVSVGSTPTALYGRNFEGITEIRAGVFMFFDGVMHALGVCSLDEIALSVLTTVIGRRNKDGGIIIDSGWSSLSSDRGRNFETFGYGAVCDLNGNILSGLHVRELNQEHGIILPDDGFSSISLTPGTLLRVLPVHACAVSHNFSIYHAHQGEKLTCRHSRMRGW